MAGLVPAIHVLFDASPKTWMPATSAGMTVRWISYRSWSSFLVPYRSWKERDAKNDHGREARHETANGRFWSLRRRLTLALPRLAPEEQRLARDRGHHGKLEGLGDEE